MATLPGCTVGHWTDAAALTGVTVLLPTVHYGARCGIDVRGGAPGSRETELLRPERTVERIHGLVFAGGSAFGLAAADGVMRYLAERGRGFSLGEHRVPIVPAAVIFDLGVGDGRVFPDARAGYAAAEAATADVRTGSVGAGVGATVGKVLGLPFAMRGGVGVATETVGHAVVGAIAVVNALGDVVDPAGRILAGTRSPDGSFADSARVLMTGDDPGGVTQNTTLVAVVTDAELDTIGCTRTAAAAHDGLARAIVPAHTPYDGDTVFALSTNTTRVSPLAVLVAAAHVTAEAIRSAVLSSRSLPNLPAASGFALDTMGRRNA